LLVSIVAGRRSSGISWETLRTAMFKAIGDFGVTHSSSVLNSSTIYSVMYRVYLDLIALAHFFPIILYIFAIHERFRLGHRFAANT